MKFTLSEINVIKYLPQNQHFASNGFKENSLFVFIRWNTSTLQPVFIFFYQSFFL